jgi:hypothetical protein
MPGLLPASNSSACNLIALHRFHRSIQLDHDGARRRSHGQEEEPMSRVLLLVSEEGATLAETRIDGEGSAVDATTEARLREEALVSGFTEEEVRAARFTLAGDPPNQP